MNDLPQLRPEPKGVLERSLAASFLLVHAILLIAVDFMFAFGTFGAGAVGLMVMRDSGLDDALPVFAVSVVVGVFAAALLAWIVAEIAVAISALRGRPRALLTMSITALIGSVLMLPFALLSCSILGIGLSIPMVFVSALALAFTLAIPPE